MAIIISSHDLDSTYRQSSKEPKHIGFSEAIPKFTNEELIISLTNRYCKLTDKASDKLILEIKNRKLWIYQIEELFKESKVFKNPFNGFCPCCQSSSHLTTIKSTISECLICGYDIKKDNPKSLLNRLRWKLGIYSFSRLSLNEVKELIL